MDANELQQLNEIFKEFIDEERELDYKLVDDKYHCFNNYVIIPVKAIERSIDIISADDIDIYDKNNNPIGYLCPLSFPENKHTVSRMNEYRLFSYFVDRLASATQSDEYTFLNHYVAIDEFYFEYYKSVMNTTEYWGGYTHKDINPSSSRVVHRIDIHEGIKIPSINHEDSIVLAIHSTSTFERFLKYYHQIELLFDSLFIAKLKSINSHDLKDYSSIMREFNQAKRSELDTLKYILNKYLNDYDSIINKMALVCNHSQIADDMFYKVGKDSNPLKNSDEWDLLTSLLSTSTLDTATCFNGRQINGTKIKLITHNKLETFRDFIIRLCSYWIYRIRCCIAHNKIGEYIFSYNDEKFVSDFGEHLLTAIIKDVFSSADLHADLNI
ncbi:hypothetical protein [Serratia proteamaculans]|uniref:hypothetical protein n=1 Tax=Serratia proteamaculans TaxID=28151 RepID=UPI003D08E94D